MGGMVQAIAGKHLPVSGLDPDQRVLGITRIITTAGRMLGERVVSLTNRMLSTTLVD